MGNDQDAPAELLEWDTSFFGIRVGRVIGHHLAEGQVENLETWVSTQRVACLYLLADLGHRETVKHAEQAGFSLVDVRVTLGVEDPSPEPGDAVSEGRIRPARSQDLAALRAIAGTSHTDTRFHADDRFSRSDCRRLYERWIERDCAAAWANDDAFVLVAEVDREPVGYVSGRFRSSRSTGPGAPERGSIGLVGVHETARGHGLGRGLVGASLDRFATRNCDEVTVVTQGRNLAAQRLYQHLGFRTRNMQLWYHRWSA